MRLTACAALAALLAAAPVAAEPPAEPTAADVAHDPAPGSESGRIDEQPGTSTARVIGRDLLLVPKFLYEVVMAPFRGLVWAEDKYHLADLYDRVFFNKDHTIGLYPTASYEAGFGGSIGAQFAATNLFGAHENVGMTATTGYITGEPYRVGLLLTAGTGERLGPVALNLEANFDRRPNDPFSGIGNGDLVPAPGMPINPLVSSTAVPTWYRYQETRGALGLDFHVLAPFHVIATGELAQLRTSASTHGTPIDVVYTPGGLVGFDQSVRHAYTALELRWDTRRPVSVWEPRMLHAAGTLVDVYAGRVFRLDGGMDFWHYGGELQQAWHLAAGPRVLLARLRLDGVTGALDAVPFVELPTLGGGTFLRGYDFARFRDRIAAVGTLQYGWSVSHLVDAYAFTDAGRVYPALHDLTLSGLRVGFGMGVQIHSDHSFLVDLSLASSIDGGVFATASFNPVFDSRPRWR